MNSWVHTKSMQLIGHSLHPHRVSRMMTRVVILMLALTLSGFVVNAQTPQNQHFENAQKAAIKGQDSKAMKEVKLSLQQNPLHADSHFLLAYLLGQENQLDQSIVGFQRALTLRPDDPDILYNLGTSLLYRGEFLSAARVLERVVTLRPNFVEGYNNLAKAYYHLSLLDLSIMAYSEALQQDPGNTIASRGISLITGSGIAQGTTSKSQSLDTEALNTPPHSEAPIKAPKPMITPPTALNTPTQSIDLNGKVKDLQDVLQDFPYLTVEQRGGTIVITGWTVDQMERDTLTRVLTIWPEVLDLSTDDVGDSNRMIEVDATIFSVIKLDQINVGFNFLRMVTNPAIIYPAFCISHIAPFQGWRYLHIYPGLRPGLSHFRLSACFLHKLGLLL
jgi:tetratricopeptide repeat protein